MILTEEKRGQIVNSLVSRVTENAPLRELVRVYNEAVQAAVAQLDDDNLLRTVVTAGYPDILEAFGLEAPPAPEEPTEVPLVEAVPV
jgi:hypothetical protein